MANRNLIDIMLESCLKQVSSLAGLSSRCLPGRFPALAVAQLLELLHDEAEYCDAEPLIILISC